LHIADSPSDYFRGLFLFGQDMVEVLLCEYLNYLIYLFRDNKPFLRFLILIEKLPQTTKEQFKWFISKIAELHETSG
jgi:hypothetical protein